MTDQISTKGLLSRVRHATQRARLQMSMVTHSYPLRPLVDPSKHTSKAHESCRTQGIAAVDAAVVATPKPATALTKLWRKLRGKREKHTVEGHQETEVAAAAPSHPISPLPCLPPIIPSSNNIGDAIASHLPLHRQPSAEEMLYPRPIRMRSETVETCVWITTPPATWVSALDLYDMFALSLADGSFPVPALDVGGRTISTNESIVDQLQHVIHFLAYILIHRSDGAENRVTCDEVVNAIMLRLQRDYLGINFTPLFGSYEFRTAAALRMAFFNAMIQRGKPSPPPLMRGMATSHRKTLRPVATTLQDWTQGIADPPGANLVSSHHSPSRPIPKVPDLSPPSSRECSPNSTDGPLTPMIKSRGSTPSDAVAVGRNGRHSSLAPRDRPFHMLDAKRVDHSKAALSKWREHHKSMHVEGLVQARMDRE